MSKKNNQKGFANVVLIGVIVLAIIAGYFAWGKWQKYALKIGMDTALTETANWKTNSISSAYVYGPELNKVKVFLYAPDEKKTVVSDTYCGAVKGAEMRSGNYKLIVDSTTATSDNPTGQSDMVNWKDSTLDIGPMQFVQGTDWDGKIIVDQFDASGYPNFIIIKQYGSCNNSVIKVYGYDLSQGKLAQDTFIAKDGSSVKELFVSGFGKTSRGPWNLHTATYNNATGKTTDTEWVFNSSKNQFVANSDNAPLLKAGNDVLLALKDGNYQKLEELVSSNGLSWNEYPNLDLTKSDISKDKISDIPVDKEKHLFGYTDGKGDPIVLTTTDYIKKYLYNNDYLHAEQVAVNKTLGSGNSTNTIVKDSGNRTVVAYYFSGFDTKYEGMDWTTLYLIFDNENGSYKLRGIAKDNWTI